MSPYELSRFQQLLPLSVNGTLEGNQKEEYEDLVHRFSQRYYGRIKGMGMEPHEIETFLQKYSGYFNYLVNLEAVVQTQLNLTTVLPLSRNITTHYKAAEDIANP